MISKHKLLAIIAIGSVITASCFSIQTFYADDAAATQVALRTPTSQDANFSGGGVRKY